MAPHWTLYAIALYDYEEENEPDHLPMKQERLRLRLEGLTPDQAGVVTGFLRLIRDHARIGTWDRQSIDRALDVLRGDSPEKQLANGPHSVYNRLIEKKQA